MISLQTSRNIVSLIIKYLEEGRVLILPTDTVFGLVCDATNKKAVERIFEIKKRDKSKPLAVFVEDIKMAKKYAVIGGSQEEFLEKNWPGAVTVILKAKKGLSDLVYKDGTVGLRVPRYKLLNLILEKFGKPIAQTSANISGKPVITKIDEALEQFKDEDIIIVDVGDLSENKPSKVINLTNNKFKIIRR